MDFFFLGYAGRDLRPRKLFWFLFPLLAASVFWLFVPARLWADSGQAENEIRQRLLDVRSQEHALLQEILYLDARLKAEADKKVLLADRYQKLATELFSAREREKELSLRLASSRQDFNRSLRFFHEHLVSPYIFTLGSSQDWMDFTIRWELLGYFVRFLLSRVDQHIKLYYEARKIEETIEQQESEVARAAAEAEQLERELELLKTARQKALEKVRQELTHYTQALLAIENSWQETLPTLAALFQSFPHFPWDKLSPDSLRIDYSRGTVIAEFSQQRINRVLFGDQKTLKGVSLRLSSGTVTIPGPGFLLEGSLRISGPHDLLFTPERLELAGVPLDRTVWDVLLPQPAFEIALPPPALDLVYSRLEIREGSVLLELSRR